MGSGIPEAEILLGALKSPDKTVTLLGNWSEAASSSLNSVFLQDDERILKVWTVLYHKILRLLDQVYVFLDCNQQGIL